MLTNSKKIFEQAKKQKFAIPAPNFIDLDSGRAFVQVADKLGLPIILAFAQSHMHIMSIEEAALIGHHLAATANVPVVLHLDHGLDIQITQRAIDLGFTSVMIDASQESFAKNVEMTKAVIEQAHKKNVVVEAEIGFVGSGQNYEDHTQSDSVYTELEDAINFAKQTNVDSLAISIGTAHGFYKGTPKINFERLEQIAAAIDTPLVLHGGSSSGDENLAKCATMGIVKINIFTDFVSAAIKNIKAQEPQDFLKLKEISNDSFKQTLEHYYKVFNTQRCI